MAKYITQLRRGVRYVNEIGATLLNSDDTPFRDDWTTYTIQEDYIDPLEGEMIVKYAINSKTKKATPRLKLGDGLNIFANLDYISVDSFILPTQASIRLSPDAWLPVLDDSTEVILVDNKIVYLTLSSMLNKRWDR